MISAKRVYDSIVRANCPFILPISTCALLPNQWRFVASSQQSHFITNLHRANGSSFFWRIKSISIDIYSYSFTHDFRYIINFILSHYQAKSELSIDFLFIIEKRPFPAMTCRRTLEMEMKALLVSERIAQSSPRFLSSIRIIAASSMMFAMFELFSNYFPLVMGHDLDNAIYDRISLFFDSTSSLQIWSRKRGESCV